MTNLDKLDAAWAATTQGNFVGQGNVVWIPDGLTFCRTYTDDYGDNSRWIAAAHNQWPAIRDELRALRKRCSDLWDVLHDSAGTVACDGNDELYRRVTAELDKGAFGVPCDVDAVLGD